MSDNMNQLPAPDIKRLCDVCDGVYSWFMSDEPHKDITLRSVADAKRHLECPVCALAINEIYNPREKYHLQHDKPEDISGNLVCIHIIQHYDRSNPRLVIRSKVQSHQYKYIENWTFDFDILYKTFMREPGPYVVRHRLESIVNIDKLSRWIEQCKSEHHHRRDPKFERALIGLIEAGALKLIDTVTLEVYVVFSSPVPTYVALSYVWGQTLQRERNFFEHTTSSRTQNGWRVQLHTLPRTLKEAILLSRDLGLRYIWIDELCIDQSHSPTKSTVIENMGAIYAAADLVIAAAAGGDSTSGLPGTKDHLRQIKVPFLQALTSQGDYIEFFEPEEHLADKLESSKWFTRGWTFQEHVFALRTLFVFSDEMFFACGKDSLQREAYTARGRPTTPHQIHPGVMRTRSIQEALITSRPLNWGHYDENIQLYTLRDLTFETDRIAALRGVLSEVFGHSDDIALQTGLPIQYFGLALT